MALEAVVNREGLYRIVLAGSPEGVYVYVWEHPDARYRDKDYLQDTWELAIEFCEEEYDVTRDMWRTIPDNEIY